MKKNRRESINKAKKAKTWGIILGTLGRQGNPRILDLLEKKLKASGRRVVTVLLSEIFPQKLDMMSKSVEAWVQIACPRYKHRVAPLISNLCGILFIQGEPHYKEHFFWTTHAPYWRWLKNLSTFF